MNGRQAAGTGSGQDCHSKETGVMRVLHTFKLYRPAKGGVISVMRDLIESAPAGVESRVLACRTGGPAREVIGRADIRRCFAPLEVMSLPLAPAYPFRQLAMAREADILASHSPFPIAELTTAVAGRWMPPCVVHWHSEVIAQKRTAKILGPVTRRYLDRAAARSEEHTSELQSRENL